MTGYKVLLEVQGHASELQVGVVAESLEHLKKQVQEDFHLQGGPIHVFLEDDTLVINEEYFKTLEPQTKLRVRVSSRGGERVPPNSQNFPLPPQNVIMPPPYHFVGPSPVGPSPVPQMQHLQQHYHQQSGQHIFINGYLHHHLHPRRTPTPQPGAQLTHFHQLQPQLHQQAQNLPRLNRFPNMPPRPPCSVNQLLSPPHLIPSPPKPPPPETRPWPGSSEIVHSNPARRTLRTRPASVSTPPDLIKVSESIVIPPVQEKQPVSTNQPSTSVSQTQPQVAVNTHRHSVQEKQTVSTNQPSASVSPTQPQVEVRKLTVFTNLPPANISQTQPPLEGNNRRHSVQEKQPVSTNQYLPSVNVSQTQPRVEVNTRRHSVQEKQPVSTNLPSANVSQTQPRVAVNTRKLSSDTQPPIEHVSSQKNSAKPSRKQPPNNIVVSILEREACSRKRPRLMSRNRNSFDEGYASSTTPSPLAVEPPASAESAADSSHQFTSLTDYLKNQPIFDILQADLNSTHMCRSNESHNGGSNFVPSVNACSPPSITPDNDSNHLTSPQIVDNQGTLCEKSVDNTPVELVDSIEGHPSRVRDSSTPLESLCVSIPVRIRNGEIIAEERIVVDNDDDLPSPPPLVINYESEVEMCEENSVCADESLANLEVFECASEEIVNTTLPRCTVSQVSKVLGDLYSLVCSRSSIATTKCSNQIVEEGIAVLACSEDDKNMGDVRVLDFHEIEDMLIDSDIVEFPMEIGAEVLVDDGVEPTENSENLAELLLLNGVKATEVIPTPFSTHNFISGSFRKDSS